jgi:hypothetical protein
MMAILHGHDFEFIENFAAKCECDRAKPVNFAPRKKMRTRALEKTMRFVREIRRFACSGAANEKHACAKLWAD